MIPTYLIPGLLGMGLCFILPRVIPAAKMQWEHLLGVYAMALFCWGQYAGLYIAPSEVMMGDVSRILYVHVPAAWISMVVFTLAMGGALGAMFSPRDGSVNAGTTTAASFAVFIGSYGVSKAVPGAAVAAGAVSALSGVVFLFAFTLFVLVRIYGFKQQDFDYFSEAATEVGLVICGLLLVLGAIFAKPTWGTYWTWDPRLTASAIMWLTFVGVSLLRALVSDPDQRLLWASSATVMAYVNIPVTYMSVKWWRSMHQMQSNPNTMNEDMVFILRMNAWAFLFIAIWMIVRRYRMAQLTAIRNAPPPLPPPTKAAVA